MMKNITLVLKFLFLFLLVVFPYGNQLQAITYPDFLYEEFRKTPSPVNGVKIRLNPTELQWPSVKYWQGQEAVYNVYLSQDSTFASASSLVSQAQRYSFYNPHQKLAPGKWYWKYEILSNDQKETKGIYSFLVEEDIPAYPTPTIDQFIEKIPKTHPRVMTQGNDIKQIRKYAPKHKLYPSILRSAEKAFAKEIYQGPVGDANPAKDRRYRNIAGNDVKRFHEILQGYVLSGEKKYLRNLLDRIDVLLTWPTNDLLGSQVLTALSMGYDILYDDLSASVKKQMLQCIEKQMKIGLKKWPGKVEARQVDNHFWQMEIAGNFSAALATINDLEVAREMLEYTYELFVARFPNLSTKWGGGWAEDLGYFRVNKSCVEDMALLMKKIAGADVFVMPWYENLPDYYTYFSPVGGQVAGFGDMHDRIADAGEQGASAVLLLASETHSEAALYRLMSQWNKESGNRSFISKLEPWYQIVNNVNLPFNQKILNQSKPNAKCFFDTGIAAMHQNLANVGEGTSVYFRSSPFGAKGHMHANQNSFNIARKGERLFYATGYYTSFADPHSMTSYRNTRASNTILVNGCGQAFGHEGYGFIKRYLEGNEMTYVCGDATAAYKPTVDKQFLDLNAKSGVKETPEFGVGDAQLKLFERHLVYIRPDVVVVYDVLESEKESDWTFLLHSMKNQQPVFKGNTLTFETPLNAVCADVMGSQPLKVNSTDQFFSPAIDFKKKYKEVPNQYHTSYQTLGKSKQMRFLAVIQLGNRGASLQPVQIKANGNIEVQGVQIEAELDVNKTAGLVIKTSKGTLHVGGENDQKKPCSILEEAGQKKVCYNLEPAV